jgi:hypothetical protein
MATPSSGPIDSEDINSELGRPLTQNIDLDDFLVRTLANKLSGAITFEDLRGKENNISSFNPTDASIEIDTTSNIVLTYPVNISAGTGTIELRTVSASGTIIESYDVTSSSNLTFSTNTLTIDPTVELDYGVVYYLVVPDYAIEGFRGTSTYNFTTETAPVVQSLSPADGSTNVSRTTNFVATFDKTISRGTGTIRLREGSASGTIIESYDAATNTTNLTYSGTQLTINPSSTLGYYKQYYPVIPSGAVAGYGGISTWNARTVNTTLGQSYCGGRIICQTSNTRYIMAPSSSEVVRNWNNRNNAVTRAQAVTGVSGWFVPSKGLMQNPAFKCRSRWDSYINNYYWTNTQAPNTSFACRIDFSQNGLVNCAQKTASYRIRAMKTETF